MSERGAFVLDADKLGHRVYEPGRKAFDQVIEVFGGDIVAETGEIDRKILGGKVFGNPAELKKLTGYSLAGNFGDGLGGNKRKSR